MTTPLERADDLARERLEREVSERRIAAGRARVRRQRALVARFPARSESGGTATRLLLALEASLREWEKHHCLILERIAYLESLTVPEPGRDGQGTLPAGADD
jgi:hypothetical protein